MLPDGLKTINMRISNTSTITNMPALLLQQTLHRGLHRKYRTSRGQVSSLLDLCHLHVAGEVQE
jgi:hypothetical protein